MSLLLVSLLLVCHVPATSVSVPATSVSLHVPPYTADATLLVHGARCYTALLAFLVYNVGLLLSWVKIRGELLQLLTLFSDPRVPSTAKRSFYVPPVDLSSCCQNRRFRAQKGVG